MKCVKSCEFIGVVDEGHICKYHQKQILEDESGLLQRCKDCERHAYYNRLVDEMADVIGEYNTFVSGMDKKIDDIHFLMQMVKEKI